MSGYETFSVQRNCGIQRFEDTAKSITCGVLAWNDRGLWSSSTARTIIGYAAPIFEVHDDINFDGYKDIWLRTGTGVLDNIPSTYWIYDPATGKFQPDPVLQDVSNPVFHPVKKEITTSSRCCSGTSWSNETYSFIDGKYVLTYTLSHEPDESDGNYAVDTETRLTNGTMTEISRKRVKTEL